MKTLNISTVIGSLSLVLALSACSKERPEQLAPLPTADAQSIMTHAAHQTERPQEEILALPKRPGTQVASLPSAPRPAEEPTITDRPQDPEPETAP